VNMVDYVSIDLDFTDWYTGKYEEAVSTQTNTDTGVKTDDDSLDKGDFKVEMDTAGYVKQNFPASAGATTGN